MHVHILSSKANIGSHRRTAGSPTTAPPAVPLPTRTQTHGPCLTQRDHGRGPPAITFPQKADVVPPHVCLQRYTAKRPFSTAAAPFGPPIRLWRPPPIGGPNNSTTHHDAATTQLTTQLKTATTQHDAAMTQLTTQLKLLAQTNQTAQLPLVPPKLKLFRIGQNLVSQHAFASNLQESGRKIRKVKNRPTYTFSPAPT